MNNQVTINKENILNAYQQATEEQKELLENMFGKDMFQPKDIRDRIKTFNDAYHELGDKHELVRAYNNLIVSNCMSQDIIAFAKLRIIAEALNEGWKPTFKDGECRYYPWFYIYTKKEYEELDEDEKKECRVVYRSFSSASASGGVVYASVGGASSYSDAGYGSRLSFKTREIAEYFGKQFIDIWAEFLFA